MRQTPVETATFGVGSAGLGKLARPIVDRAAPHPRLFARLDDARAKPLVWIQGQPGAGKTTLVAAYLVARGLDALWYRLDEGDADPATLFLYLAEAARRSGAGDLPHLTPEHRSGPAAFARRFFRQLFAEGRGPLVLDDYQDLPANAVLHALLPVAAEEAGPGRSLIVMSRSPPPAALARLRVNGLVHVIGGDDLRMRLDEAADLARARGLAPEPPRLVRLLRETDGWAAGLVLLLEAGATAAVPPAYDGKTPTEVLFEYFAGEVFGRMEPHVRRLLAVLALMPDATAAAAADLGAQPKAGAILEDLRRRNYFTTCDVQASSRYRFHPLFRDFLLAEAVRLFPPRELTALKVRAADLLAAEGQPDPAAALLAEAEAFAALGALVRAQAPALIEAGRFETLAAWIDRLPVPLTEADGWLSYWRGLALLFARAPYALRSLERAAHLFDASADATGAYLAWAGAADAIWQDTFGDKARFDSLIAAMPGLRARYPDFPTPAVALRVASGMCLALACRSADRTEIARWKAQALAAARQAPGHGEVLGAMLAINDLHDANYAPALALLETLPEPATLDHRPMARTFGYFARLTARLYRQMPGAVAPYAEEALVAIEAAGLHQWLSMVAAFAANDAYRRGDAPAAVAWLGRSAAYADKCAPERGAHHHYAAAQVHTLTGALALARTHAQHALAIAQRTGWPLYEALARLALAEALAEGGDWDAARAEGKRLEAVLARSATASLAFAAALLRAETAFARDGEAGGTSALTRAMALGRAGGYRCPALMPTRRAHLYAAALRRCIEPDFVTGLVRQAGLAPPDPHEAAWPRPLAIRALGTFEIRKDGRPLGFARKTPQRLVALLKAISAFGGTDVPEVQVIDAVWPDAEGDAGRRAFKIALHRLRRLLGDPAVVVAAGGRIGLDPALCWLDLRSFEALTAPLAVDETEADLDARRDRALALYAGDLLRGDEATWANAPRRRARARLVRTVHAMAERRLRVGDASGARVLYRRALEAAPDAEDLCQALMRHCLAPAHRDEGLAAYARLRALLAERTGAEPAPASEALHRQLLAFA